ncbi:hypothetical protein F908_00689 [Acinetobacter sp. NIPH 284]|uniref:hypothetical protein n=1 Tax=Acinetobacter sp. NIPH 284 TaxID=1217704 RepID=UPI0002CDC235|nr:hypothetical protein [Acinetobacter sp. NIPH 284]ENW83791.1 hypothetical protein F908_00689 [Acinetobacter sp. NIPH 284]
MSDQEIEKAKLAAERKARGLGIFEAAMLIVTDGELSDTPSVDWIRDIGWEIEDSLKNWETCTIKVSYSILGNNRYGGVDIEIKLGEDSVIYSATKEEDEDGDNETSIKVFRMGSWVDRFITYSKEVRAKYEKQQLDKIQQERNEALKPFLEIDF